MSKEQGALSIEIICQPEWLCLKNGKGHHSYLHYLLSIFKSWEYSFVGGAHVLFASFNISIEFVCQINCFVCGQFFAFFPFPK